MRTTVTRAILAASAASLLLVGVAQAQQVGSAESAAPGARIDFAALAGHWKVVGVEPGPGVGAFARNAPAYLGQILIISGERLAWANAAAKGATLSDVCTGPVTERLVGRAAAIYAKQFGAQLRGLGMTPADPEGIECNDGNWGPEAAGGTTAWLGKDGSFAMSWYDGVVLKLRRAR